MALAPVLSPHGVLSLKPSEEATALEVAHSAQLEEVFVRGSGHGLLYLGADEVWGGQQVDKAAAILSDAMIEAESTSKKGIKPIYSLSFDSVMNDLAFLKVIQPQKIAKRPPNERRP